MTDSNILCPKCHHVGRLRINRNWWMRLIPKCRHYECASCGHCYVIIHAK